MTKTPYFDAYMRGERSNNFFYKKLLTQIQNEPSIINEWYIRTHYFEEDWRYDD